MEVLIAMSLIALLSTFVLFRIIDNYKKATLVRGKAELSQIASAAQQFIIDNNGALPGDVNRGLPSGIETYLGEGSWPEGPWPGSVYDWDVFPDKAEGPNYQVSIRFCPLSMPALCRFPDEPWAANFDYHSSAYLCIQGQCKAHPNQPADHPGYCLIGCQND